MKRQLNTMLSMQDAMNERVHPQWRDQGYEWYRAIWVECAELLDHYGWKWWKKQQNDMDQVRLELVDIWHFGMSDLLQHADSSELLEVLYAQFSSPFRAGDFRTDLEQFTSKTLVSRRFDMLSFVQLLTTAGLGFDCLYREYVGKNVLNFFRQDNGYQSGTYQKVWDGKEDNVHLAEIVSILDSARPDFRDEVYAQLSERYPRTI